MAQVTNDNALDAALDYIIDNATTLILCSSTPADRAAALTAELASVAVTSGDFAKADGDTSGRKVTLTGKTVTPTVTGTATDLVIISATEILDVTTISSNGDLSSGVDKSVPTYDVIELRDKA